MDTNPLGPPRSPDEAIEKGRLPMFKQESKPLFKSNSRLSGISSYMSLRFARAMQRLWDSGIEIGPKDIAEVPFPRRKLKTPQPAELLDATCPAASLGAV